MSERPKQAVMSSNGYSRFAKLASLSVIWQIVNLATPLAYVSIILKSGGIAVYGTYSTIFAIIAVAMCVSEYGYQSHGIKKVAESDSKGKARNFWIIVHSKVFLCMCIFPFYLASSVYILRDQASLTAIVVAYAYLIGQALSPTWFFFAEKKLGRALYISGSCRLVGLVVLIVSTNLSANLIWPVMNNALTNLFVGLALFLYARKMLAAEWQNVSVSEIKASLTECFPLFLSNTGVALYTALNVIVVNVLLGSALAGYFSVAERIVKSAQNVFAGLSSTALAIMVGGRDSSSIGFSNKKMLVMQGVMLGVATLFLVLFSDVIVSLFGGHMDPLVADILRTYSIVLVIGGMSSALNAQVLIAAGAYAQVAKVVMFAGMLNIITIQLFTNAFGVKGSVWSVVTTETFILLATVFFIVRKARAAGFRSAA